MMASSVVLTGASGFLGKVLKHYLESKRYEVFSIGRSSENDLKVDINGVIRFPDLLNPKLIVHSAGKAHAIPKTQKEAQDFFIVNFSGTKNLCSSLEASGKLPESFVFISTVAVYDSEGRLNTAEDAPLNGTTPYAQSKIAAEDWLNKWCSKHNIRLAILRLPLIAGVNPPGNLKAMIDGIQTGRYLRVGDGSARKSIVLASDVAAIIPKAAEVGGIYNLTDGYHPSFAELEVLIANQLGKPVPRSIPLSLARVLGWTGDIVGRYFPVNSKTIRKMTTPLTFDDTKAREKLGWAPKRVLDHFVIA